MQISVIVNGAQGRMGKIAVQAISQAPEFKLLAQLNHQDHLAERLDALKPDIAIDFTSPEDVFENTRSIIAANVHPVIGTTGLNMHQIEQLSAECREKQLGAVIAPNFSLAAILMMRYAQDAARYFPQVEIIEMHHEKKKDAPSGTAIKTCEMIAAARDKMPEILDVKETIPHARGAIHQQIPIHAVRLPGKMAHQMVVFGSEGETLTIQHDTVSRECYIPGIILACQKVTKLNHLVYGLEQLL